MQSPRVMSLRGVLAAAAVLCGCAPSATVTAQAAPAGGGREVAVYALSRGKGVPDATRAAREQARALFQQLRESQRVLDIQETRIGLEGERRICATFASAGDAAAAVKQLRALAEGVELFNIVLEPCARAPVP